MHQRWALLLGLLAGSFVGCATDQPTHSTSWLDRLRGVRGPTGPDVVMMEVALLERPVGDRYLNQDLWALADEGVVAMERRALLEDNGLRIGQVGGITPAELQALLTSERSNVNPRLIELHAGNPTTVLLGPKAPQCRFQVHQGDELTPVTLEMAQCTLSVLPTLTADGHTRLKFTPQFFHGETKLLPQPAPDGSGWVLQEQRPTERFPDLSWEVVLAPNEYVMIGARFDRPDTLGHQCFVRGDEPAPVQRLLVIRTGRPKAGLELDSGPAATEDDSFSRAPPLALQASWSTARGSGP